MSTNLFLTRPVTLQSFALSAPVGSGKTKAAIQYIAKPHLRDQNFIYVAPTVDLIKQTAADIRRELAAAVGHEVRNVNLIHSLKDGERPDGGSVGSEAIALINGVEGHEGQVVILTTTTFLAILSQIRTPGIWHVILDEAFSPASFQQFSLGTDIAGGWTYFSEVFHVDPTQGYRIVPRATKRDLVRDIAAGRFKRAGEKYMALQEIAKQAANPALRCELVMTDKAGALLRGETPPSDEGRDNVLSFATYVSPEFFAEFFEVIFLSALFEQTVLYHLWTKALGVTFERHPRFPEELLRDTHGEQARYVAVGHLLHEGDNASLHNLSKNIFTGEAGETNPGDRVIDRVVQDAARHFGEEPFLLQTNARYGYTRNSPTLPVMAQCIPTMPHGQNQFAGVDNVAALAVTNPNPQQMEWVMSRTGMSAAEVTHSYRIHSCYQAFGRCSIRNAVPTTNNKVCLTVGAADAKFLLSQFPGSHWLGKVGSLPPLAHLGGHDKTPTLTDTTAEGISKYLHGLGDKVTTIKSATVKGALQSTCGPATWTRAARKAVTHSGDWKLAGKSFHRVTAADYGLATA